MAASSAFISCTSVTRLGFACFCGWFVSPPRVGVSLVGVTLASSGTGFVLVASPRSEPSFC